MDKPVFVQVDTPTILAEVLADMQSLMGYEIMPATPEYAIASCLAYHKTLTLNRINSAGLSQLVQFATAPILDYLAENIGVTRLPEEKATCTVRFNIVPGHLQVLIPLGTRVSSADGTAIFETVDDYTVEVGVNTADIIVEAQTAGLAGNGYEIDTITNILDPYAFVSSVANLDATTGGSDAETDEQLRARIKLAPAQFSVAGSKQAYEYWAKTASPLIKYVNVMTYSDDITIPVGTVQIFPLLDSGVLPSPELIAEVLNILSSDSVRPLTDTVTVIAPVHVAYDIEITVTKTKDAPSTIADDIKAAAVQYCYNRTKGIGLDIINSQIEKACSITGVYDISVTIVPDAATLTGDNLILANNEVGLLYSDPSVTISGTANE